MALLSASEISKMSGDIDGVHVVTVESDHSYRLDEPALRSILMNDVIKDLPVAVVSVAGAFRGGKSFLLNFFLRYLSAEPSAREDGSWMGKDDEELVGFSWRAGSERNTTGILMWPEPFLIRIPSGEKVAVLLMDTQGTFDSNSSVRDCSTIFALSTLLSSTQIYNLKENIKEDDLQNLQLFTDYGKLMKDETGKPFQVLEFLIRDWMNPFEYHYGHAGGDQYLENKLKVKKTQPKELQELRQHIRSSFDSVTCFLMPHPGLNVISSTFKGKPKELTVEFVTELKELATSIFSPNNLKLKLLGGQPLKSRELFNYFKMYMSIFNSDKIPTPKTILAATAEAGLLMAYNESREQFETNMNLACGPDAPSMPAADVVEIHAQQLAAARATFRAKKLFGERADIDRKLEKLNKDLTDRERDYLEINKSKTLKAQNNGIAAYESSIRGLTQGKMICVHARDLKQVHDDALAAATVAFDANRKKPAAGKTDPDREKFINDFDTKYEVLRLNNEQNNKSNASDVKTEYFQHMVVQCNHDPKLTEEEFRLEHERALARALEEFDSRRNRPNSYTEDVFKFRLEQAIILQYGQLKQINASSNAKSFQLAMVVYNESTLSVAELRKHCLHPDTLKESHEEAKCNALMAFRPKRVCSDGFDESDKEEAILINVFNSRYEALNDINMTANESAVTQAFIVYKQKFDELSGYFFYFLSSWDTAKEYHKQALAEAMSTFYSKRRDRKYHASDEYISLLEQKCKKYYNPNNK